MKTYGDTRPGDLIFESQITGIVVGYSSRDSSPILLIYWLDFGKVIHNNSWYLELEIQTVYTIYRDGVKVFPPDKL